METLQALKIGSPRTDWVREVAAKTVDFSPTLSEQDQRLSLAIYGLLRLGEPAELDALAETTGITRVQIEQTLEAWPGVYRDDDGSVVGYWGLTIRDMGHPIHFDGRTLWAWCAWDTLFLPELLNATVEVTSKDPITGNAIRLTVTPDGVQDSRSSSILMSCLLPDESMAESIVSSFCHHIHFFESEESATRFAQSNPHIFLMTLEEAVLLAKLWNRAQYTAVQYGAGLRAS